MSIILFRTAFALGLGLVFAMPAAAASGIETRSTTVSVSDLKLSTPEGAKALHHRVSRAANMVCGDFDGRDLAARAPFRACRAETIASVAPQIALAMDRARTGRTYALADIKVAKPAS